MNKKILTYICAVSFLVNLSFETKSAEECFEKTSRAIFKFNMGLDNLIIEPIAKGYNKLPEPIKNGTDIVGNKVRARIVKNKMAPPFKKAEMDIIFSEGISKESSLIDLGVEKEIITKSGSFFSYGDIRLGQGRDSTRKFLKEDKAIFNEIEKKIREAE